MFDTLTKVKDFINKEKCGCNVVATYFYMPSYEGKKDEQSYFCEECVPRGCSCEWNAVSEFDSPPIDKRWKWIIHPGNEEMHEIKEGEYWVYLDEQGREHACCEFMYDEKGFDKE